VPRWVLLLDFYLVLNLQIQNECKAWFETCIYVLIIRVILLL
jgi:hypothetical protein